MKPKKQKAESDSLFGDLRTEKDKMTSDRSVFFRAIVEEIDSGFRQANDGESPNWEGRAFSTLKQMVTRSCKHWTLERWKLCIKNRYASEINPADPPHIFIAHLPRYASGLLNQFYKPLNGANGNGKNGSNTERLLRELNEPPSR